VGNLFHLPSIPDLAIRMPVVLLALTVHEFMHGYVAWRCGDDTAKHMGRLTLNPLAHLDLLGTICLMLAPIGWAKPVPVNPYNFRHPSRDDILVSLAGVASNFAMAAVAGLILRGLIHFNYQPTTQMAAWGIMALILAVKLNLGLCFFNLLPIAPLDGHHVVRELLPYPAKERFMEFSRYGPIILLALVLLSNGSGLSFLMYPIDFFARIFIGE
jgi:Zn-dependent protease